MRQGSGVRVQGSDARGQGSGIRGYHSAGLCPLSPVPRTQLGRAAGFTLIELIVVVAIIGILATIAVPAMRTAPQRAREAALKEDLFTLRSCLDQFHADRGRYPTSLDEMVGMGYLRGVPVDPVTGSKDSWVVVYEQVTGEESERQQEAGQGIIDIHSGSEENALDGTKYADW
ncbi:MAG TPA: prepilin-type N-terminal cleavage/methylation domain-containing protein [Thermoanaerobaculaceae bacterium]|nr:prepilin-type N-terminal cleavage/methylation domain-containing protein [Thermoanaerobaculaceae bacterium]